MHITRAELVRNAHVRECLIDMSDRDYLAARICWRTRLPEQFLWCALQAVEKQLKAILVLNNRNAKGLNHNVEAALARVLDIRDLKIDPPPVIRDFVAYIGRHGPQRYGEQPIHLRPFVVSRAVSCATTGLSSRAELSIYGRIIMA